MLLHKIGLSLEDSDRLIPLFLVDYNILRYDLLGHGHSSLPPESVTVELLIEQMEAMGKFFDGERFYIIANPASGLIAARYCRRYGHRVAGLILISPLPAFLPLETRKDIVQQMRDRAETSFDDYKQFLLSNITTNRDEASFTFLRSLFDRTSERAYFELMDTYLAADFNHDFRHIQPPVLVLTGAQDTLFPVSIYGMDAACAGASFQVIPRSSALTGFDNPQGTTVFIRRFIRECENGVKAETAFRLNLDEISGALAKTFRQTSSLPTFIAEASPGTVPPPKKPVLTVRLVNTFQVRVGEVEIAKGWNLRKSKSLLLYLLFHRSATREELIDVLWPDSDLQKARNQLRVSLNYLKSLLHQEEIAEILYVDREHVFLQGEIQCDAIEYIEQLTHAYFETNESARFQLAKRVLETTPQKLLMHNYDDWFLCIRESIESQYCELSKWVAAHCRSMNRMEEALRYVKKAERMSMARTSDW